MTAVFDLKRGFEILSLLGNLENEVGESLGLKLTDQRDLFFERAEGIVNVVRTRIGELTGFTPEAKSDVVSLCDACDLSRIQKRADDLVSNLVRLKENVRVYFLDHQAQFMGA